MTAQDLINNQKKVLEEAKALNGKAWLEKMDEFIALGDKYLEEVRENGRKGGSSTSEAKRRASAENGRKGGRPRKSVEEH